MEYIKIREMVSHYKYEELEKYFVYLRERAITNLAYTEDNVTMYRCQGQISILDQLLKLKSNVINDVKKNGKSTGERK